MDNIRISFFRKINIKILSSVVMLTTLGILYLIPAHFLFGAHTSFCIFHKIWNIDCPGCGVTRAIYSFLHGDIIVACRLNLAILSIMPICLVEILLTLNLFPDKISKARKVLFQSLPVLLAINYLINHY